MKRRHAIVLSGIESVRGRIAVQLEGQDQDQTMSREVQTSSGIGRGPVDNTGCGC